MKNIILAIIIPFFFISCEKTEVILIFDKDVKLPSSIFDFAPSETKEFQELEVKYDSLKKIKPFTKKIGNPINLDKTIKNPFSLKAGLKDIIGGTLKIRPVFDLKDISIFYRKIDSEFTDSLVISCPSKFTAKSGSTTPKLHNIVTLGCLPLSDCEAIKMYLNNLGLGNIVTVLDCSDDTITPNNHKETPTIPILGCSTSIQYRNLMRINLLNNTPYDSIDGTHFSGINGRNANLIVVENSHPVDWTHAKFDDIQRFSRREESLSFGPSTQHSTWTFGVLFANEYVNPSNPSDFNCCVGVSREANLRKIVYMNVRGCGNTDRRATSHGALLKAINQSVQGDVLLLEYSLGGLPVELNLIDVNLISTCTNILGVTVVEPIGNAGNDITSKKPRGFIYEGILVSSATLPTTASCGRYVKSRNANYSDNNTDIDCFGLDDILTTNPGNSYAKYGFSSAAAAQIAGLALDMQGYYFSKTGCYLTPQEMKRLFRTTPSSLKVKYIRTTLRTTDIDFDQVIPDAMNLKMAVDNIINR